MKILDRVIRSFKRPAYESKLLLGEALLKDRIITFSQLEKALELQTQNPKKLGEIIVDQGYASEELIIGTLEKHYGVIISSLSEDVTRQIKKKTPSFKERFSGLRIPISAKFAIAITFAIWLTVLILSFATITRQKEMLYQQTLKAGKISLKYFTNGARIPLLNDDTLKLNTLIKEAANVEGLLFAIIVDRGGVVKAHSDPDQIGSKFTAPVTPETPMTAEGDMSSIHYRSKSGVNVLNVSQPITLQKKNLGTVHVGISLDFIEEQTSEATKSLLWMTLLIVLLGISTAIFFGLNFSRPIYQLVSAANEIAKGNFKYKVSMSRKDELGDLATAFNFMSNELWKKFLISKSFGRYVSPEVLNIILSNPEEGWLKGSRTEATILFSDVRGFTQFSSGKAPDAVVECLNQYFEIATRHILENGGYIDKFIGDAVLGVFCIPIYKEDHAERAIKAAIGMQKELQETDGSKNPILAQVGTGLNSGDLVAGNLGCDTKLEYTVIGDTVNVASRLTGLAGAGEIIVSKETLKLVKDIVDYKELPSQKVKGKDRLIEVFQVLSLNDNKSHEQEKQDDEAAHAG